MREFRLFPVLFPIVVWLHAMISPEPVFGNGRVALVLIQEDYPDQGLPNSEAGSLVDALSSHGFEVREHRNLADGDALKKSVEDFCRSIPTMSTVLVYVSAHSASYERNGPQISLMPTKAKWDNENAVRGDDISLSEIQGMLEKSGAQRSFVFIESPRSNPFAPESMRDKPIPRVEAGVDQAVVLAQQGMVATLRDSLDNINDDGASWVKGIDQKSQARHCDIKLRQPTSDYLGKRRLQFGMLPPKPNPGDHWVNRIGMVFVWCPAGSFQMGVQSSDLRFADAVPMSTRLSQGFWIAKYELTQREFQVIRGRDSRGAPTLHKNAPTTNSGANDKNLYKSLHDESKLGKLPSGWEYRLPTEAQWEYACRAGSKSTYCFGDDRRKLPEYANFADATLRSDESGLYSYAESMLDDGIGVGLGIVGTRKPNAWGIHDMHGNLYEWCADKYQDHLVGGDDPLANPTNVSDLVARGGSWVSVAENCASGYRAHFRDGKHTFSGLRLVIVKKE